MKTSTAEATSHPKGKVVIVGGKGKATVPPAHTPKPKKTVRPAARPASNKAKQPGRFHGF